MSGFPGLCAVRSLRSLEVKMWCPIHWLVSKTQFINCFDITINIYIYIYFYYCVYIYIYTIIPIFNLRSSGNMLLQDGGPQLEDVISWFINHYHPN